MPGLARAGLARAACLLALSGASSTRSPKLALSSARTAAVDMEALAENSGMLGDWEDAVRESKEVSRLSDLIHRTQIKIQQWRRNLDREQRYHKSQLESIKQQLSIRKRQHARMREQLRGYEKEQEEQFRALMCHDLFHAFAFKGNQGIKVQIARTCSGLKLLSITEASAPTRSSMLLQSPEWGDNHMPLLGPRLWSLALRTRHLALATQQLEARCGLCRTVLAAPSDDLKKRLKQLEALLDSTRKEYRVKCDIWAQERAKVKKEERKAGNQVYTIHKAKFEAKKRAKIKVEKQFCPVVMANYGLREKKIIEFARAKCS